MELENEWNEQDTVWNSMMTEGYVIEKQEWGPSNIVEWFV